MVGDVRFPGHVEMVAVMAEEGAVCQNSLSLRRCGRVVALAVSLVLVLPVPLRAQSEGRPADGRPSHIELRLPDEALRAVTAEAQSKTRRRSDTLFTTGAVFVGLGVVSVSLAGANTNLCPTSTGRYATVEPCPAPGANLRLIGGLGLLGAGTAMMIAGGRQVPVEVSPSRVSVRYRWSWQ